LPLEITANNKKYIVEKGNRIYLNHVEEGVPYHISPGKYSFKVKYKEMNDKIWYSSKAQFPEISKAIEIKPGDNHEIDLNPHHYFATLILNLSNTYSISFKRKAIADNKKTFWPVSSFPMPINQATPLLLKGNESYEFKLEVDNQEFTYQLNPMDNTIYFLETDEKGHLKSQFSYLPYTKENLNNIKTINWQKVQKKD